MQYCIGNDCPLKHICKRYNSILDGVKWFTTKPPFKIIDGKVECDIFLSNGGVEILTSLKDIFSAPLPKLGKKITAGMPKMHTVRNHKK